MDNLIPSSQQEEEEQRIYKEALIAYHKAQQDLINAQCASIQETLDYQKARAAVLGINYPSQEDKLTVRSVIGEEGVSLATRQ
jgi:hypothetical protein